MSSPHTLFPLPNIRIFVKNCRQPSYKAKRIIINSGDYSHSLFYFLSSSVSVIGEDTEGKEITLVYLNQGDFFGEMGLLRKIVAVRA